MSSTSIPDRVKRLIWSRSAGYCQRPSCNADVFCFFADGSVTSIDELAHIIAEKSGGPRGASELTTNERSTFENILLLCPSCHTLIDKNPEKFPVDVLLGWKAEHERRIHELFRVAKAATRAELRAAIAPRLRTNHSIFTEYGPHSEAAASPLSDASTMWARRVIDTVVPNNRFVVESLDRNQDLLNTDELNLLEQFRRHQEGFEYNHLSGDKSAAAPLFPREFATILSDETLHA
jgi:hypothetical protein